MALVELHMFERGSHGFSPALPAVANITSNDGGASAPRCGFGWAVGRGHVSLLADLDTCVHVSLSTLKDSKMHRASTMPWDVGTCHYWPI